MDSRLRRFGLTKRRTLQVSLKVGAVLGSAYLGILGGLFVLMRQPPRICGKGLSKIPGPAFMLFPMETMWCEARKGKLTVGQEAPGFDLPTREGTSRVQLSAIEATKPVVLVFGSYT